MGDRLITQIRFRKALWTCPKCGQEDVEDFNIDGGNTYEHTCSACSAWFNSFKEYDGCIGYPKDDYDSKDQRDIEADKIEAFEKWRYDQRHPPEYKEPTTEELQVEIDQKQTEIDSLQARKDARGAVRG